MIYFGDYYQYKKEEQLTLKLVHFIEKMLNEYIEWIVEINDENKHM